MAWAIRPSRSVLSPPSSARIANKMLTVSLKIRCQYGLFSTLKVKGNRAATLESSPRCMAASR